MHWRLSPLALAISTSLIVSTNAWAAGAVAGNHGDILITPGQADSGAPGLNNTVGSANGADGADFTNAIIYTLSQSYTGTYAGQNGGNSPAGTTGFGGSGGGSVFGSISIGGSGGYSKSSALGGNGGAISSNTITYSGSSIITLTGSPGGGGGGVSGEAPLPPYVFGASGSGGAGGGSVIAAYSLGGGGGGNNDLLGINSTGGTGGKITDITLTLSQINLNGATGGSGGVLWFRDFSAGAGGAGGAGGGSVFAAYSQGGPGGGSYPLYYEYRDQPGSSLADGGAGGAISRITLTLSQVHLSGATGGAGGSKGGSGNSTTAVGAGGAGGAGGGSVFAAFSQGGAAGGNLNEANPSYGNIATANGGAGSDISDISLTLNDMTLTGSIGGAGGRAGIDDIDRSLSIGSLFMGAGGAGGPGGGSVFAAFSQGGAGGFSRSATSASANGGAGGTITGTSLSLTNVMLKGAQGGAGGQAPNMYAIYYNSYAAGGAGGAGGGSVFAAFSQGGPGGDANTQVTNAPLSANGGAAGDVSSNKLSLTDVHLIGAAGGNAGAKGSGLGASGQTGIAGGSIFGGYSEGGPGGSALYYTSGVYTANGGQGGNANGNYIRLAGTSSLTGHIWGGYSQGGQAGVIGQDDENYTNTWTYSSGLSGLGGEAINNTITLVGPNISIGGSVYGGFSLDGDVDFATLGYSALNNSKTFMGNTLNLDGYRGSVEGIYNFEYYNWALPASVINRDVIIEIRGNDLVDLNNTKHTVADMISDGKRLNLNDEIVLISKAQGSHQPTRTELKQGYFIIYDATLGINNNDEFVLQIAGKDDTTPTPPPIAPRDLPPTPAGRLNPTSKAFLEGRASALALVNQGADMVSNQLSTCATGLFLEGEGGRSQYKTGSHVKVNDAKLLLGGRACFDLPNTSKMALALFAEHGNGNYHSRNQFTDFGKVSGHGDLRYTGAGVAMHMDVANTGTAVQAEPVLGTKNGLYVDAALRAGSIKSDFASNDLVDASGKRAEYNSKSTYASAGAGLGYVWNLDAQQQLDLYGRYTWSRIGSDSANVGADKLHLGADTSSRLRVGTRYSYAWTERLVPYAGVAYEYDFDGRVSGKVFDMSIDKPELKGGSGMLEFGIRTVPINQEPGFKIDLGVQGFAGQRKGASGSLSFVYDF